MNQPLTKKASKNACPDQNSKVEPAMQHLGIGIDTARYGHHVSFLREDKQPACPPLSMMESRLGYDQLKKRLEHLHQRFPNAHFHLRIDAAGQYAANLEAFVRSLDHLPMTVSVGEPKRNKDYHRAHSPKRKSDSTESHAMARYAVVERPESSHGRPAAFAALRRVASRLEGQTKQSTRLINQLHETLSASFPELATIITDLSAGWVLQLLEKYPTNQRIAAARLSSLEKVPFIPNGMAEKLQIAAKTSVGTLDGEIAEALIEELVSELRHSLAEEKRWRELLTKAFDALPDGAHHKLATIKGIGKQTAAAIVATAIDINRFPSVKHLIGYYGIFPEELQSGVDKFGRPIPPGKKIMCRKGNDLVRGLLWQCAKCASATNGGNPAVRALYLRRLAKGDLPQVAWGYCMTKLLHQVFGIWTSGSDFDAQYEVDSSTEEKTEASGPTDESEAPEEPVSKEVTEAPASLEPVIEDSVKADGSSNSELRTIKKQANRPAIDYAALREQVSLQQVLERVSRIPIRGVQHRGPCPIHEPDATTGRKFSANLKRQVFRCFESSCGAQGNVLDLWQKYRGMELYEAAEDLAKTFGIDLPLLEKTPVKQKPNHSKISGGHHPPSP
jgi:transposase